MKFAFFKNMPMSLAALMVAIMALSSCGKSQGKYVEIDGVMLGTTLHISAKSNSQSIDIYNKAMEVDAEMKRSLSVFDENSLLNRLNANLTDSIDNHIIANLELASKVYEISGGVYDVTVKPLVDKYGFINGVPQANFNVDSVMEFVGFDKIRFKDGRLIKSDKRIELDFNSIAKGYTVDLVAEELNGFGIKDYIVEIGGEVRCRGENPKEGAWRVGIETPYDGNNNVGNSIQQVLSLKDCALATSGNYRRFYIDASGRKIAHIIDSRTGQSAVTDVLSATVIAPTCAEADAYATMFVALGSERAIEVAKELKSEDVMVYLITAGEDGEYVVYYSAELAPMMSQTKGFTAI